LEKARKDLEKTFSYYLFDPAGRRTLAKFVCPIASQHLLFPIGTVLGPAAAQTIYLRAFSDMWYRNGITPFWSTERSMRGVLTNVTGLFSAPVYLVAKTFEYFEQVATRLATGMTNMMLQLLEYFGVDVAGYWQDIANLTTNLLSEVIVISITSILIYAAYRLIKLIITPKEQPFEQHESKNEFGKNGKKMKKQQKAKHQTMQVKNFVQRSSEGLECNISCTQEDCLANVDSQQWAKIGACNDLQSFYGEKPLGYCIDELEEDPDTKHFEFIRSRNTHIAVSFSDAEDFLCQKSELKHIRKVQTVIERLDGYGVEIRYNLLGTKEEILT
jgi:hypothetical protein